VFWCKGGASCAICAKEKSWRLFMSTEFQEYLKYLEDALPAWSSRDDVSAITKLGTARTFANWDSASKGPGGLRFGKKVMYEKTTVIKWVKKHLNLSEEASHDA